MENIMQVLVIGGTGQAGRPLVADLVRRGHQVRVLSRTGKAPAGAEGRQGDIESGSGVPEAVRGIDVVVDCSNVETVSRRRAERFFLSGTRHLLDAEQAAGVRHHILLSIVAIDRIPYPYYTAKLRQEEAVAAGPVPWTVLRATPFHEFVDAVARRGRVGPFTFVPKLRTMPVAAADVARTLADLAEGPPIGRAPDIGGPREEQFADLVRTYLRRRGTRTVVVPINWPGRSGRAMRDGAQIPRDGIRGEGTFEEWLASEV
jgi:uncharacterized protein YbjT (DUF2867 family)